MVVAQEMNFCAASAFCEPAGTASDQAHSQLPRLPRPLSGASAKPTLSATRRVLRVGHEGGGDGGVDPHAALARIEQRQVLVEAVRRGAGRTGILHQVDVEVERVLPLRLVELGLPVLVEPAGAEGVRHGRQEGHVLAPAGLAAQADAVDLAGLVGHLAGGVGDEVPGRRVGHRQPGLLEQVLAIHDHRAFAVEGRGDRACRPRRGRARMAGRRSSTS